MSEPTSNRQYPVLFIHGLWIHASAWEPWQELFHTHGYTTSAPGWPGDAATVQATRDDPSPLDGVGIEAICRHYADLIDAMPVKPIVVGHSFGGLIAQELLANGYATAAVAIDPARSRASRCCRSPAAIGTSGPGQPGNKKRTVSLTSKQFHYSFGNTLTEEESDALFTRWTIPGPGRPLFEDATANFVKDSPAAVDSHHAIRGRCCCCPARGPHRSPLGDRSGVQAVRRQPVHHRLPGRSTVAATRSPSTAVGGTSPS